MRFILDFGVPAWQTEPVTLLTSVLDILVLLQVHTVSNTTRVPEIHRCQPCKVPCAQPTRTLDCAIIQVEATYKQHIKIN